ncbi:MAG: O-antigen ligase family protein [Patescibacteria group bacterium]|nr:O-antigen ligase family protein [Patescibacteria group bacterium]MDD5490844.1 O-antigen ligase family protein [Patescibacteria group bacterium]
MDIVLLTIIVILLAAVFLYILKNPVRGIYLITFFLPFEYIGSYDWRGITIRPSQVLAVLTIVAWILDGLGKKSLKFVRNPIFLPVALYLLVNIIALVNAPNLAHSILVLFFIIFTVGFGFTLPNLVGQKDELIKVIKILFVSTFLVSLFGLYQFIGDMAGLPEWLTGLRHQYTKEILGFTRVQSTFLEPLYFANFLIIPICLLFANLSEYRTEKSKWKVFEIIVLVLALVNFILTVSRGAYLGLFFALLTLAIIYRKKFLKPRFLFFRQWRTSLWLACFLLLVIISSQFLGGQFGNFVLHLKDSFSGAAFFERAETFGLAIQAWQEHPIVGIGPGSFGPWVYVSPFIIPEVGWKIVNNLYLEILAESGILGLGFFLWALVILFIKQIKVIGQSRRIAPTVFPIAVGLLAAFVGVFIQYNTFSIIYIMQVWFLVGLIIATLNITPDSS